MLQRLHKAGLVWPTLLALAGLALLIGFGTWQMERKRWKDGLVAKIAARVHADPVPLPTEPGSGLLPEILVTWGCTVLVPAVEPDLGLQWAEYRAGSRVRAGPYRVPEVTGPRLDPLILRTCDAVLVPSLAVDRRGCRLGRGGGSYDRALVALVGTSVPRVALLFSSEVVERVPSQAHDVPMDVALTPDATFVVTPRAALRG